MELLLNILIVLALTVALVFLGVQFYKLGGILKNKYPIIYRFYLIFWVLITSFILISGLVALQKKVADIKHREELGQLDLRLNNTRNSISDNITRARAENYTDDEIYNGYKQTKEGKDVIKREEDRGFSEKEIARSLGFDI